MSGNVPAALAGLQDAEAPWSALTPALNLTRILVTLSRSGIARIVLAPKGPAVNSRRCNLRKTPAITRVNPDGVDLQGIVSFERLRK